METYWFLLLNNMYYAKEGRQEVRGGIDITNSFTVRKALFILLGGGAPGGFRAADGVGADG